MEIQLRLASKFKRAFLIGLVLTGVLAIVNLLVTDPQFSKFPSTLMQVSLVFTLLLLLFWVAALIANEAFRKGRDWYSFFVLSLFFPLIMWIIASVVASDGSQPSA